MDLISVIIPIYNSYKYLVRCLESISNQDYENFEVLIIDDGSTDSSHRICQNFILKDRRFKYYYKSNGGVSSARNYGLKKANGKYIAFIDADDWVESDYISKLYCSCEKHECDISYCARIIESPCKSQKIAFDDFDDFKVDDFDNFLPTPNHFYGSVWGALFSKKSVSNIFFDNSIFFGEDMIFAARAFRNASKICRINKFLYHYWKDDSIESLSKGKFSEQKISNLSAYKNVEEIFQTKKQKRIINGRYGGACYYFLTKYYEDSLFLKKYMKCVYNEYRRSFINTLIYASGNFIVKFKYLLFLLFPKICIKIKKNREKGN